MGGGVWARGVQVREKGLIDVAIDRIHYDAVLADLRVRRIGAEQEQRRLEDEAAQLEALILGIEEICREYAGIGTLTPKQPSSAAAPPSPPVETAPPAPEGATGPRAPARPILTTQPPAKPALPAPAAAQPPLRAHIPQIDPHPGTGVGIALEPGGLGLTEAIEQAALEARHDRIALVARALELRPGTGKGSAQTMVSTMLRSGRLKNGDDLVIRLVRDGKIQGLPPIGADEARLVVRTSHY